MTDGPIAGHFSIQGWSVLVVEASTSITSTGPTVEFDRVYADHFELVFRLVRRLGVAPSLAEDAVQDVFLVVHRRLSTFEGRSSIKTWLVGIAFRVAKDFRRRATRKGGTEPLTEALADPGLDPQELASIQEAARTLEAFLDGLDEDRRAVFVLSELEGWSMPEVAEGLGIKLNTAYSRLRLARRDFEAHVERHLKDGSPR